MTLQAEHPAAPLIERRNWKFRRGTTARRCRSEIGMRKILFAATAIAAASGGGATAASQGNGAITGLWSTGSQGGRVELYRCGAAICGKVNDATPLRANPDKRDVKNPDPALRARRLKGLVVLRAFTGDGRAARSMIPRRVMARPRAI